MIKNEVYKEGLALAMESLHLSRDSVCLAMGSGYDFLETHDKAGDTTDLDRINNTVLDAVDIAIKALISFGDAVDARVRPEDGR